MRLRTYFLICALLALAPSTASARWIEARSPNFVVYSDGGEDSLRRSVQLLEDYDRLLRTLTGTTAPPSASPLKVYLVSSAARLNQIEPISSGVLGFYRARVGGTAAFAVRGDRPGVGGEEVLMHEYAHHFATRYYPAYYPAWYSEGFAEYVMTARFAGDRIEVGRYNPGRALTLLRGTWLPVDRIFSGQLGGLSREQTGQFYAESWLIVHYLFADEARREALTRYFADLHRGVAETQAFRTAFGTDHKGFEAELKRYMAGHIAFSVMARPAGANVAITVRPLSPAADDLLLPLAALMIGIPQPEREAATFATIKTAAARYPDDPYAQRVLARAEIGSGDRAAGTATIDRLLQSAPNDAELLYFRGLGDFYTGRKDAAVRVESFAAARPWFARAAAADPGYYTAIYRLAQTASANGSLVSEETLAQLTTAHALAPLVGDIAVDAATALMASHQYAAAEQALIPIASNPHGGNVERARAMLASIRQSNRQD
ncbi:hypothetical protein FB595_107171 [Sphingobium sp. AEW010]|nr:hypothetical protein C7E20_04985 [Sphingobium sp. AEW4]TWD07221.1 hypothetical protein FB595_107171 [Sphingobium sp. AEW010]TWD24330.1 hypothetical protein FB596_1072 [Sphingobium sp. AEW013]TWD26161.1 hypothetical protein FB594_1072 [Sphingobium sp. AEW001]